MKLEVIVSTLNCTDYKQLYKDMNLDTDAIIVNQAEYSQLVTEKLNYESVSIYGMTFFEKGVGLSRNSGFMRSRADICIMADDDMVYVDNYAEIIQQAYKKYSDADMLIFNVRIHQNGNITKKVKKNSRVRIWNYQKYGTVTFTFKRQSILRHRISFSLLFGGGTGNGSGEDSLFLSDVLKKKMKVYAIKDIIADVYNEESSWFTGYNEQFLEQKGALFFQINKRFYKLLLWQFVIRRGKLFKGLGKSKFQLYKIMKRGGRKFADKK
ncbi:glycosyltransferase family A protein [Enterococcus sp. BWB1-3]|uniref:glycosyltransferase family A protein n=1 Tax=Enterococcus sp. BWB1-3 TaxID=2787713 RepID=UPI001F1B09FE|nr:glycosyltransferase family A protein [Enterococcus sp. BWB1-3]